MKGIYCLSMSHRFTNVEVRSRYGVVFQDLESRVKELKYAEIVKEGLIISTCNRLEIVFLGSDLEAVIAWIAFKCCTNYDEVKASFRVMQSMEALKHIYRVISGLDSKIFGETNIVGQVKRSLEIATTHQLAGKTLNFIYQNVYKASKKIHNSLALPVNSLANCFEKAFEKHFPDPRQNLCHLRFWQIEYRNREENSKARAEKTLHCFQKPRQGLRFFTRRSPSYWYHR